MNIHLRSSAARALPTLPAPDSTGLTKTNYDAPPGRARARARAARSGGALAGLRGRHDGTTRHS